MKAQTVSVKGYSPAAPTYIANKQNITMPNPATSQVLKLDGAIDCPLASPSRVCVGVLGSSLTYFTIEGENDYSTQITEIVTSGTLTSNVFTSITSISVMGVVSTLYENVYAYWGGALSQPIFLDTSISNLNATVALYATDTESTVFPDYFENNQVSLYSSLTATPSLPFGGVIIDPESLDNPAGSDVAFATVLDQPDSLSAPYYQTTIISPIGALYVSAPSSPTGTIYMTVLQQGSGY